jgi:hypothetical protein
MNSSIVFSDTKQQFHVIIVGRIGVYRERPRHRGADTLAKA